MLWTSPEKFYVSSEEVPNRLLIIDRITGLIKSEAYRHQIPSIVQRKSIVGLVGVINLISGPHLVIAVSKARVGVITSDNHVIFRLDGVQVLPFARSEAHIRPEQQETAVEQRKMVEAVFNTPYFYFSYTIDITNYQQKSDVLVENSDVNYVLNTASPCFTWNYFMLKSGGLVQDPDFHPWCLALVHGAVYIQQCSLNGKLFRWSILSRRSTKRAGTRFFRRGVDFDGYVANFVETEQIIEHKDSLASFVQIRGSIPFFWTQTPTLEYLPKPRIYYHVDHETPFRCHFDKLTHNYGAQIILNLINHTKHEGVLQDKFGELCKKCDLQSHRIDYEAFDFHARCSKSRYAQSLSMLMAKYRQKIRQFGCFIKTRSAIPSKLQTGVVRTNCMDSLDRTNVVQSMVALENLKQVLDELSIPNDDLEQSDFFKLYRNVWANHANIIALQYAGSEALKTDLTRSGKRTFTGMLRDLKTAIVRYLGNNFADGQRQDAIDLVLGHYTVDPNLNSVKDKSKFSQKQLLYYLPLILLMSSSLLLLTTLLFSDSQDEFYLLLMCFISLLSFLLLMIFRHSKLYVNWPKYCPYELVETLKI